MSSGRIALAPHLIFILGGVGVGGERAGKGWADERRRRREGFVFARGLRKK